MRVYIVKQFYSLDSGRIVAAVVNKEGKAVAAETPLFQADSLPSIHIAPGSSLSFTFDELGEYLYLCSLHANEVGRIVVTE